jgi:hypothetical protein
MKNLEVYQKNPLAFDLVNNGVAKVAEIGDDSQQLKTLRFELENFVCDGEYAKGLERILTAYLAGLSKPEQQAAWVSGFFGSGKSHLVKMLRYLWVDYKFPDGASARSIAHLPTDIQDQLVELTNRGKQYGGLRAAAGTLGAGAMDNVRLAFLQLIFRAAGLPENYAAARFMLWLREKKFLANIQSALKAKKLDPDKEIRNFYVSPALAQALVEAEPSYGTPSNAQGAIRAQFPTTASPTIEDTLDFVRRIFGDGDNLPCTLLVIDEVQQYIGDKIPRAMDVQEIAEHCCKDMKSRLIIVATGQSALTGTASLARLQARFTVKVPLSDTDVENVIRKTVLAKKPECVTKIQKVIEDNQGEISRQLQNTRLAATSADNPFYALDYPLLPVRRRFWEKVLRNVDASGTTAQLRTQLKIVFDAARETAEKKLGHVVPADFIYDQIAADLLNTGELQREYHETIIGLRDNTPAGALKSRLCSLMFLISKLPRSGGADDGVRATQENLADLLVEDLESDGVRLRQDIPGLLAQLVSQGKAMQVENEYNLQTREGSAWNQDFNARRSRILNDESRLGSARDEVLQKAVEDALKKLSLTQGASKQARDLEVSFSSVRPQQPNQRLVLWMRHGWAEEEKTIDGDARAAGTSSPMLFGYLPRTAHDDLKQNLASKLAAEETINAHGTPSTDEAIQACNAIKTRLQIAEQGVADCGKLVLSEAKVFLGGGTESTGKDLMEKVKDAAEDALQRLFSEFTCADHPNWAQVLTKARAGDVGALLAIGYQGEVVRQPVCQQIYNFIGAGKKGREVREKFKGAPFGWPQDAIDASLVILTLAGNLRATLNGQSANAVSLTQAQIGSASFHVDVPPLTVMQRLDLKALFQKLGVATQTGQESTAAASFLGKLLALADSAGGEPPLPEKPTKQPILDLQSLSGNAQLLQIHKQKDQLGANIDSWTKMAQGISKRRPRWLRLKELSALATALPEIAEIATSISALEAGCGLLNEPDAVPPLIAKLLDLLRNALNSWQADMDETLKREQGKLAASDIWQRLTSNQREQIVEQFNLKPGSRVKVSNESEILETLRESTLPNRRTLLEAVPQRFQRTLEEAARLLVPKATRVTLPSATISDAEELESWLSEAKGVIEEQLQKSPVIV